MMKRLLCVLFLAGCAANAQTVQQPIDMHALRSNPLYPTLAQYDRQIAALRATLHSSDFARTGPDMDAAAASLQREVDVAASQIQSVVARSAGSFAQRQDNAVSAILAAANASAPSNESVRRSLEQAYRAQYARLRSGAAASMAAYRDALNAQQNDAYRAYVRSVQNRVQQAYYGRAAEMRERESALALDLARRNAGERLMLRARLQTLYLRPEVRHEMQARLAALQSKEDRAVGSQRGIDQGILNAYRAQLLAQANADIAKMAMQLQQRTAANLAARRDVYVAQTAGAQGLQFPAARKNPPPGPDLRSQIAALRVSRRDEFRANADAALAAYQTARSDISARFVALREQDSASVKLVYDQIAQLERDRKALYAQLVAAVTAHPQRKQ